MTIRYSPPQCKNLGKFIMIFAHYALSLRPHQFFFDKMHSFAWYVFSWSEDWRCSKCDENTNDEGPIIHKCQKEYLFSLVTNNTLGKRWFKVWHVKNSNIEKTFNCNCWKLCTFLGPKDYLVILMIIARFF